jgi:lipopolysaccharide biosynthesis glycosyltransferase
MDTPVVLAMNVEMVEKMDVLAYSIQAHISNAKIYLITDKELQEYPDWVYKYGVLDLDVKTLHYRWTKHMFLKIYIDKVFPELDKCIYLDIDTIVLEDISDLLIGDDWLMKAADHRTICFNDESRMNSGVIAWNFTDECRQLLEICRSKIDKQQHDENIIKEVFGTRDKITYVDKNYNVLAGQIRHFGKPKVLHYAGMTKPWTLPYAYAYWFRCIDEMKIKS